MLSMLDIIENYYKVMNTKVDGSFYFQSNLVNNDRRITNIVQGSGVFYDTAGNRENGTGPVSGVE